MEYSRAEGLVKDCGANHETVAFCAGQRSLERDHTRRTLFALGPLDPELDEVETAVALIAAAWWSFLDDREAPSVKRCKVLGLPHARMCIHRLGDTGNGLSTCNERRATWK